MAHLNQKGPRNDNAEKGRKLGFCAEDLKEEENHYSLGFGMGKRRKSAG